MRKFPCNYYHCIWRYISYYITAFGIQVNTYIRTLNKTYSILLVISEWVLQIVKISVKYNISINIVQYNSRNVQFWTCKSLHLHVGEFAAQKRRWYYKENYSTCKNNCYCHAYILNIRVALNYTKDAGASCIVTGIYYFFFKYNGKTWSLYFNHYARLASWST